MFGQLPEIYALGTSEEFLQVELSARNGSGRAKRGCSRHTIRRWLECYPLLYRPPVLCLLGAEETYSAFVGYLRPSLYLETQFRGGASKNRCEDGNHV